MSSSSSSRSNSSSSPSGAVYKKIGTFLSHNTNYNGGLPKIQSSNTITNPYTNKKKRRYIDIIGDELYPSLNNTIYGKCYNKLRRLENDLDCAIAKRHNFISNQLLNINNTTYNHQIKRILRLILSNNNNQSTFKLEAKLFNPKNLNIPINSINNCNEYFYYNPFKSIISRIKIEINDNETVEWNNPNWKYHQKDKDKAINKNDSNSFINGIEVTRDFNFNSNSNSIINVSIYLCNWFIPFESQSAQSANKKNKNKNPIIADNHNALCRVSHQLGLLLGLGYLSMRNKNKNKNAVQYHSKSEILQCLGEYIRQNNLIRGDNSMAIDCDNNLIKILGVKTIYSANLWKVLCLKKHILAPDPIRITYDIGNKKKKKYDIVVRVPSLIAMNASKLMESHHHIYDINNMNNLNKSSYSLISSSLNISQSDLLEQIKEEKKELDIYESYTSDPISTIDVLVSNQRENLQIIKEFCDNARCKSSQYFAHSSIYKDIKRYLKKQQLQQKNNDNNNNDNNNNNNDNV